MGWSFRIARVGGTDVKIHVTFLLLLAWIGYAHYRVGGWDAAWSGIVFIILLFACVVLHEFGHVFAAKRYGIETPDITLLPIGGVARLRRMPDDPTQELVVALAGPAVNVVIAAVLFLILGRVTAVEHAVHLEDPRVGMLSRLAWVNVALVLFNLIPAFPMDGGRVLRALLAMVMSHGQATQLAANVGQGIAFLFGFLGLLYNPLLIFIAIFVYLGAAAEARFAQMKEFTTGVPVAEAMMTEFVTLPATATLDDAVDALVRTTQHEFPVLDSHGTLAGILTRDKLIAGLRDPGPQGAVAEIMHRGIPSVKFNETLDHAFGVMQDAQCPGLGVINKDGQLVGLITPEAVGEMLMIRSVLSGNSGPSWRKAARDAASE